MKKETRYIGFHLDPEDAKKLDEMTRTAGLSTSAVLRAMVRSARVDAPLVIFTTPTKTTEAKNGR